MGEKCLMSTGLQRGLVFLSLWLFWKLSVKKHLRCREIAEIWRTFFFFLLSFKLWKLLFQFPRKPPTIRLGMACLCCELFQQPTSPWDGLAPQRPLLIRRSEGLEGQKPRWWIRSGAGRAKWRTSHVRWRTDTGAEGVERLAETLQVCPPPHPSFLWASFPSPW